jgi:hypothetical protein
VAHLVATSPTTTTIYVTEGGRSVDFSQLSSSEISLANPSLNPSYHLNLNTHLNLNLNLNLNLKTSSSR